MVGDDKGRMTIPNVIQIDSRSKCTRIQSNALVSHPSKWIFERFWPINMRKTNGIDQSWFNVF